MMLTSLPWTTITSSSPPVYQRSTVSTQSTPSGPSMLSVPEKAMSASRSRVTEGGGQRAAGLLIGHVEPHTSHWPVGPPVAAGAAAERSRHGQHGDLPPH